MPFRLHKLNLPRAVYWFAALAFALRIVARLFYTGIEGFWIYGYGFFFDLAQSIAQGHGYSVEGAATGFRVPMYSILLAGITLGHRAFWPIAIAQSAMGAGTVLCAALLACRMFAGAAANRAATLAAAATAVYPYYVIHDTALQETSLYTLLTLAAVLVLGEAAREGRAATGAAGGLLLGLDVLTRATLAPFAVLAPLWLLWRRRGRAAAACALLLAASVLPWIVRNAVVLGAPTLSTETGTEFWAGNCGFLFRHYPQESSDLSKAEAFDALSPQDAKELQSFANNEALADRWLFHKGLECVRAHPGQTVIDGFRKIAAGFYWLPSPRRGRGFDLVNAFSYGPVMVLGLWGMGRRRAHWREDSSIYLLFLAFVAVTAVFWAHTSHRVYLDVYWIVFGAGAVAETVLRRRKQRTAEATGEPAEMVGS
ncbi:MAG: glycosyltransferase family 39 protein [Terracidiphilus sp.]|jgi:hypothetical protein